MGKTPDAVIPAENTVGDNEKQTEERPDDSGNKESLPVGNIGLPDIGKSEPAGKDQAGVAQRTVEDNGNPGVGEGEHRNGRRKLGSRWQHTGVRW